MCNMGYLMFLDANDLLNYKDLGFVGNEPGSYAEYACNGWHLEAAAFLLGLLSIPLSVIGLVTGGVIVGIHIREGSPFSPVENDARHATPFTSLAAKYAEQEIEMSRPYGEGEARAAAS
jgi:hypothetical protein